MDTEKHWLTETTFKKGKSFLFTNYRPISLLPSMSKIYEYVVFEQLLKYMEDNRLFYKDQFGFRPGHSTELASLRFVDTLVQQMDNFYVPTSILTDLSKAFDTLDHDIVLSKLRYYGVSGVELNFLLVIFWKGFSMSITPEFVQRNFQLPQECPKMLSWGPYYF